MQLILFLLSILLLGQSLSASESYTQIVVAKTSHKQNLKRIKRQLDAIHIKMFVKQRNHSFFVYSQKFPNTQEAMLAFKKVKHFFKYAKLLYRGGKQEDKNQKEQENKYFVNFALGMQNISGDSSESGLSYKLESGYNYSEDIFLTLSYQNASSSNLSINNIFVSGNKIYELNAYSDIYAGGLLGYGRLKKSAYSQSTSIIFGLQTGYRYKLYKYLGIFAEYQGVYMDHIVKLNANKELKFSFTHNLQLGVTYNF